MILGTLGASPLGDILSKGLLGGKGMYRTGYGMYRPGYGLKKESLTPFHPLTNFEIQDYFSKEKRFNGVYSRNSLPKK